MSARDRRDPQRIPSWLEPPRPKAKKCKRTGKLGYATQGDALVTLSRASRKKAVQRIYHCPFCSRWHMTSKPKLGQR